MNNFMYVFEYTDNKNYRMYNSGLIILKPHTYLYWL